jgi:quercetin dioxygenase-like cupin family protein
MRRLFVLAGIIALCFVTRGAALRLDASPRSGQAQSGKLQGVTYRSPSGTTLRLMLDESNVGSEVTLGEMVFPHNSDSGDHKHGAIEMFYVVSGELEHVVNGRSQFLKPGMSGFVKPPDSVRHKTGPAGAKVVVVWVPGEEGRKIAARWQREP